MLVNAKAFDALDKADAGRGAQGRRRRRGARLETSEEKNDWYQESCCKEKGMKILQAVRRSSTAATGRQHMLGDGIAWLATTG